MGAYYSEHDPKAAAWLRELIKQGHIAPGEVDERSIEDVIPTELSAFNQCHFFAGIGVWSYALRQAGWPDDKPVWTGSCPCQSFSAAGGGKGFADERHLWPAWFHLIDQCRPRTIFGEQVEAAIRFGWLDLVQSDLEGIGYACGAVPFPACGIGAPHIRQRLYFVADADGGHAGAERQQHGGQQRQQPQDGGAGQLADAARGDQRGYSRNARGKAGACEGEAWAAHGNPAGSASAMVRPGPTNGFWRDADWLHCTDGRWRPVKPGTFPLVDGSAFKLDSGSAFAGKSRVAMLRGAGNAIVAPQAIAFIRSYMETL